MGVELLQIEQPVHELVGLPLKVLSQDAEVPRRDDVRHHFSHAVVVGRVSLLQHTWSAERLVPGEVEDAAAAAVDEVRVVLEDRAHDSIASDADDVVALALLELHDRAGLAQLGEEVCRVGQDVVSERVDVQSWCSRHRLSPFGQLRSVPPSRHIAVTWPVAGRGIPRGGTRS